jgi:hypothetical protein
LKGRKNASKRPRNLLPIKGRIEVGMGFALWRVSA